MSEENTQDQPRTSLLKVFTITVLPLILCIGLAWVFSYFTGLTFGFSIFLFCSIGYFVFLKEAPVYNVSKPAASARRRRTKAEIEAARAKRFYIGQDDNAKHANAGNSQSGKPRDVTQPANIIDASSLTNREKIQAINTIPDGFENMNKSPERQEKKLNPERDLALKPDDI